MISPTNPTTMETTNEPTYLSTDITSSTSSSPTYFSLSTSDDTTILVEDSSTITSPQNTEATKTDFSAVEPTQGNISSDPNFSPISNKKNILDI